MDKLSRNNVVIDICPKCKGMWLDDNEIDKLLNRKVKKNGKK